MGTVNYKSNGEMIEIIIRDFSGQKIEVHKCSVDDKKKYKSILRYLNSKYGFSPEISPEDSVMAKNNFNWWD